MARRLSGERRKRLVRELLLKSERCHWCPKALTEDTATLDHIITVSEGGNNRYSNQVLSCEPCNRERGSMKYDEFHRKRFLPKNVLAMSHETFGTVGTSLDEFDLEVLRLELGARVSGAILKENAKPLRERLRSSIRSRFKVIDKIKSNEPYKFYTETKEAEHCLYTYNQDVHSLSRRRFLRTWGERPFKDMD